MSLEGGVDGCECAELIVIGPVLRDGLSKAGNRFERVRIEPLTPKLSPVRLDHRAREVDSNLRDDVLGDIRKTGANDGREILGNPS